MYVESEWRVGDIFRPMGNNGSIWVANCCWRSLPTGTNWALCYDSSVHDQMICDLWVTEGLVKSVWCGEAVWCQRVGARFAKLIIWCDLPYLLIHTYLIGNSVDELAPSSSSLLQSCLPKNPVNSDECRWFPSHHYQVNPAKLGCHHHFNRDKHSR